MAQKRPLNDDENENVEGKISEWLEKGCGCSVGNLESQCSQRFSTNDVTVMRDAINELSREEKDVFIKGYLLATRPLRETSNKTTFNLHGNRVCMKTFLFVLGISLKYFVTLTKHYDENGIGPRIHGNTKKTPHNASSFDCKEHLVTFLHNFAEENAVTLPGRIPGYKDNRILLLPSHMTKDGIFLHYKTSCEAAELPPVGRSLFYSLWTDLVPYIVLAKPMTDLCWICQQNNQLMSERKEADLHEMSDALQMHLAHLKHAITGQNYYREQCKLATEHCANFEFPLLSSNRPCSFDGIAHYSWDYAQQTHYLQNPFQPGPI